jgi:expansin (peptidoglycan-binding protein)
MKTSPSPTSKRFHTPNLRLRTTHVAACGALGLSAFAFVGCGAAEEEGGGPPPSFSGGGGSSAAPVAGVGGRTGTAGTSTITNPGLGGAAGSATNLGTGGTTTAPPCTGDCMLPPVVMTQACTANSRVCQNGAVAQCDPTGTILSTSACATGSSCVDAGTGPVCQVQTAPPPPTCSANQVFCNTANEIGTCNAEGSAFTAQPCPVGTNCTGAGVCTPVSCSQQGLLSQNGNGGVTVYWFAQGTITQQNNPNQDVNCSFNGTRSFPGDDRGAQDRVAYIQDPTLFGALNSAQYAGGAACGACVAINPINGANGGQPVIITIADSCNPANNNPTCTSGHIDLSRAAYQRVTNAADNDFSGITWRFVPCAGVDTVEFELKEPSNQYWNEFLVVGHKYPIVRAEVMMADGPAAGSADGTWVNAQRGDYNYWRIPAGNGMAEGAMGTYRVRVTDINGGIVEEQLELRPGLQGGSAQFGCQ